MWFPKVRKTCLSLPAAFCLAWFAHDASAEVITLDFEGLGQSDEVRDYYNDGTSFFGLQGPDFGVTMSDNATTSIDSDAGGLGDFGGEPSPSTVLFFPTGNAAVMTYAAGFENGFSFFYSAPFPQVPGVITVHGGVDGTGAVLAELTLPTTPLLGDPVDDGVFSPFVSIGVEFDGVARSVSFGGGQQLIAYDNITFGSATATGSTGGPTSPKSVSAPRAGVSFSLGLMLLLIAGRLRRSAP